ncbi:MAG: hypothetical protein ABIW76_15500 [Fibrobacteria bacterium]
MYRTIVAMLVAAASCAWAQRVTFEKLVGPEGGPLSAMGVFGDTLVVAPQVNAGVAGPYYSWDGGKTWAVAQIPAGWENTTEFVKVENRLFASSSPAGLLASKDGGKSWDTLPGKRGFIRISVMGKRLIGFGYPDGITYSDDLGESWQKATAPFDINKLDAPEFTSMAVSGTKIYAGFTDGRIFESTDLGKPWKVFFDNAERRKHDEYYIGVWYLAIEGGNLYFVDDDTLSRISLSSAAGVKADHFMPLPERAILFGEEDKVYIATNYVVYASADKGKTWDELPVGTPPWVYSIASTGNRFLVLAKGGLYACDRGKNTWDAIPLTGLSSRWLWSMGRLGSELFWVDEEQISVSSDKGTTWRESRLIKTGHSGGGLQFTGGELFYYWDQYDRGTKVWKSIYSELPTGLTSFEGDSARWLATNNYGRVMLSRDHRKTWTEIKPWGAQLFGTRIYAMDGDLLILESRGGSAVVSADFGLTWKSITLPTGNEWRLSRFRISDGRIFAEANVFFNGRNVPHPYVSDDQGATWKEVDFGIAAPEGEIVSLQGSIMFAQADRKLMGSKDAGRTWTLAADIPQEVGHLNSVGPLLYAPRAAGGYWAAFLEVEKPIALRRSARAEAPGSGARGLRSGWVDYMGRVFGLDGRAPRLR